MLASGSPAGGGVMLSSLGRRSLAVKALRATSEADSRIAAALAQEAAEDPAVASAATTGAAKVLVIGSGGREHAIATKLASSPRVTHVYAAPGNGGTGAASGEKDGASKISNVDGGVLSVSDHASIVEFVKENGVSLVAVGPEVPLVEGVADALTAAGIACFGPSKAAARLEASKAWSKDFMARNGIRTAQFATFSDFDEACAHVKAVEYPVVVKASGLAAGKGVLMPTSKEEALACLETAMVKKEFGDAGAEVVVEEFLEGEEVRGENIRKPSLLAVILVSVQVCGVVAEVYFLEGRQRLCCAHLYHKTWPDPLLVSARLFIPAPPRIHARLSLTPETLRTNNDHLPVWVSATVLISRRSVRNLCAHMDTHAHARKRFPSWQSATARRLCACPERRTTSGHSTVIMASTPGVWAPTRQPRASPRASPASAPRYAKLP